MVTNVYIQVDDTTPDAEMREKIRKAVQAHDFHRLMQLRNEYGSSDFGAAIAFDFSCEIDADSIPHMFVDMLEYMDRQHRQINRQHTHIIELKNPSAVQSHHDADDIPF